MGSAVRNYKDNVLCMLYKGKRNLLSLYNAVNGTAVDECIREGVLAEFRCVERLGQAFD